MEYLEIFPVVGVMGPRQSGKSTMVKELLGTRYEYISFDDFEIREQFYNDQKKFIQRYNHSVIFDEVQHIPELFPLLKLAVDQDRSNYGKFVITGSGQFLMGRHIAESLAGRIGMIPLLPMEFRESGISHVESQIVYGSYPELIVRDFRGWQAWYSSYLDTYIQKDLRQMVNISDISGFTRFLRLLAGNTAQVLNISSVSRDLGISVTTLNRWLSVLEQSYVLFFLQPWYDNLGKRIVKSPKLYFYDTGLVSWLTGISSPEQWEKGILYGPLFENFIIADILKQINHKGLNHSLYYFRTNHGDEIDLIIDAPPSIGMLEVKASVSYRERFQKSLVKYNPANSQKLVLYQGDTVEKTDGIHATNFKNYLLEYPGNL